MTKENRIKAYDAMVEELLAPIQESPLLVSLTREMQQCLWNRVVEGQRKCILCEDYERFYNDPEVQRIMHKHMNPIPPV